MARADDRKKIQRLLDDVKELRHGGLDHQHPRFKEWRTAVQRALTALLGEDSGIIERFKDLQFRSKSDRMWRGQEDTGTGDRTTFLRDLDKARDLMEQALEEPPRAAESRKKVDEAPVELQDEAEPVPKKESDADEVTSEAVERREDMAADEKLKLLLKQLEKDLQDPGADLRVVQKTMEELLKVKRKQSLLARLMSEAQDPKASWGKIKELMKGVWDADKEILIDVLPDLLQE